MLQLGGTLMCVLVLRLPHVYTSLQTVMPLRTWVAKAFRTQ